MSSDEFKKKIELEGNGPDTREPRRIQLSSKKSIAYPVTKQSSTSSMLDDALSIVGEQVDKLKLRSRHEVFESEDIKTLHILIKSLVDLSKEEREREKSEKDMEDLSKLSHEELLELASSKLTSVKEPK